MGSYQQAIEDNIEIEVVERGFHDSRCTPTVTYYYKIPCEMCGRVLRRIQYSRKRHYVCDYCRGVVKKKEKLLIDEHILNTKTQKEKQFDKAVEELKSQVGDKFIEYQSCIETARKRVESYGSIPEVLVAIELLKLKYRIIPQQKIGNYKVDFAIPQHKIIIEVDGITYHRKINHKRESSIQLSIGLDWNIIHIPAEYIRKDISKLKEVLGKLYRIYNI